MFAPHINESTIECFNNVIASNREQTGYLGDVHENQMLDVYQRCRQNMFAEQVRLLSVAIYC